MVMVSSTNSHTKEISIRRRISEIYNRRQEDFTSLREYNDYLEEVECMIFDLVEGIDVGAIEEKIKKYSQENAEQIMVNRARKAEELAAALAACKAQPIQTETDTTTNQSFQTGQYAPAVAGPMGMGPQPVPLGGGAEQHQYYGMEDDETMRIKAEKSPAAGGFLPEISKRRALEEAFSTIWL